MAFPRCTDRKCVQGNEGSLGEHPPLPGLVQLQHSLIFTAHLLSVQWALGAGIPVHTKHIPVTVPRGILGRAYTHWCPEKVCVTQGSVWKLRALGAGTHLPALAGRRVRPAGHQPNSCLLLLWHLGPLLRDGGLCDPGRWEVAEVLGEAMPSDEKSVLSTCSRKLFMGDSRGRPLPGLGASPAPWSD